MFQKIWQLIKVRNSELALQSLSVLTFENAYVYQVAKILEAEANLQKGKYKKCFKLANETLAFFHDFNRKRRIGEFSQDQTGIEIHFLETCILHWILARALAGLTAWHESFASAKQAQDLWETYRLSRFPFLELKNADNPWKNLPQEIQAHIEFVRKIIKAPHTKKEWLNLLVPENFHPKKYKTKTNGINSANPLVTILIATYRDAEWLQLTIDHTLKNAGYENFEIVIILQREPDNENDSTGRFLETEPYLSDPKIKVIRFDEPLAAERAKTIGFTYCSGELIIGLDAHVIPSKNFMGKTVRIFLDYPEVSLLGYGIVDALENQTIRSYFFNEVPYFIHGAYGMKDVREKPEMLLPYKPGLYIRHCLMGAGFCFTAKLFKEVGGYLINDRTWGDKTLGISAYLCGYQIFVSSEIVCIHRAHLRSLYHPNPWTENFKIHENGYALEECGLSSLMIGYFYCSENFFQNYYIPKIKEYSGDSFAQHWQDFQEILPSLKDRKVRFWKNAVRTMREYWLEYGDYIWAKLEEKQRKQLFTYYDNGHEQKRDIFSESKGMKIYVSLTTIPSRISGLKKCIDSLLNQTVKPYKIFINIPYTYKRFDSKVDVEALQDFGNKVQIVRCDDFGPGTKLLGCKNLIKKDSLLILVDDDLTYKSYMIETFLRNFLIDPFSSFSFYTYRMGGITIGQSSDGFAISTDMFDKLDAFYEMIKNDEFLFFHDDAWISLYLHLKNCSPVSLRHRLKENDRDIYTIFNAVDGLYYLPEKYSRLNLNDYCASYFKNNLHELKQKLF